MYRLPCLLHISTVNGAAKKKPIKTGASSGHISNLKQSILENFDIYAFCLKKHRDSGTHIEVQ